MRAVAGRPIKVRFRFEDEGGTLTDVDPATTVSVDVTDGAGVAIVGSPFAASLDGSNTGIYVATVPARAQLDVLTATATGTVGGDTITLSEQIKLVDRRFAPLSLYRQDPTLQALSLNDFLARVDQAEDAIENELNFSPVLIGARVEYRSRQCTRLFVPGVYYPDTVYGLTRNDIDVLTGSNVHVRDNAIEIGFGYNFGTGYFDPLLGVYGIPWLPGVYKAWIAHGLRDMPGDLAEASVALARHYAQVKTQQAYPDRATRIMTEASEIWLARPGSDAPFGLPEVDAAIVRHRLPEPMPDDPGAF